MTFNAIARQYLTDFQQVYKDAVADGATAVELASRPQAHRFVCELWNCANNNKHSLKIRHEANVSGTKNTPDWRVEDGVSRGVFFYGDHKSVDLSAPFSLSKAEQRQLKRYLKMGRPVFIFDGLEFIFFESDSLDNFERLELISKPVDAGWNWAARPINPAVEAKFKDLLGNPGFRQWTEEQLVEQIAIRARMLADTLYPLVTAAPGSGATLAENQLIDAIHKLHQVVRDHHDPSLSDPRSCANFIAQVLAFGLFFAHTQVPITDKTPRERLETINTFWSDKDYFKEAEKLRPFVAIKDALLSELISSGDAGRIYDELGSILAHVEYQGSDRRPRDFHSLFERFFAEFDKKQRYDRGVFYTPEILTQWMVAFTGALCELTFGKSIQECADKIVDPCCGTGGFIESFISGFEEASYSGVPQLLGLEILPAPYALAHSRLAASTASQEILGKVSFFLVDTLSDLFDDPPRPGHDGFSASISEASKLASPPVRVIIGNPPSSSFVASRAPRTKVSNLMEVFRPPASKRSDRQNVQKALNNESYRFFRWACDRVLHSERGIVAFVLPGAFLHSVSFQYARAWVLNHFQDIWILELDADVRTGSKTHSLFQVQQGRMVLFAIYKPGLEHRVISDETDENHGKRAIKYFDISGRTKSEKEEFLGGGIDIEGFLDIPVHATDNRFAPTSTYPSYTWSQCWPLTDADGALGIFHGKCSAVKLAPSSVLFHTDPSILKTRCTAVGALHGAGGVTNYRALIEAWFKGQAKPPNENKLSKDVCEAIADTVGKNAGAHKRYSFRPFLPGWAVYDTAVFAALNETPGGGTRPRPEVAEAFLEGARAIAVAPAPADLGATMTRFVSFCWNLPDNDLSARGNAMIYADLFQTGSSREREKNKVRVNIRSSILDLFEYSAEPRLEILGYLYGVLSSQTYLDIFEGVLYRRSDPDHPPRLPIVADPQKRRAISELGVQIARCEDPDFAVPTSGDFVFPEFAEKEEFRLTMAKIDADRGWIRLFEDNNEKVVVREVPGYALAFRVAGHDVVKKWIRERQFPYFRRTFRKDDLEQLLDLLNRITCQHALIEKLDAILEPLLSIDAVSGGSLILPEDAT